MKMKKTRIGSGVRGGVPRRALSELDGEGVNLDDLTSFVCNNLDQSVGQILELIQKEFGLSLNRAQPYEMLRRAAAANRLHYIAPTDSELSVRMLERHEWLYQAHVVRTSSATDLARRAALLLMEFVRKWDKLELHVGIAGGGLMARTVRFWAGFLKEAGNLKLERLIIHALVAATYDPRWSSNGFAQWLVDEALPFKTDFIALPTPAFVGSSALDALRRMERVRDVFDQASCLDIIVTSAGAHWDKGCSGLNVKYKEEDPKAVHALEREKCIGDLIWQPFSDSGPINKYVGLRPVTLIDLDELPGLVRKGKRVLLVLAPCGGAGCGKPKTEMLRAILAWRDGITDLVVDARTAALALRR
jgi:DNA-binding transcriptional regulator LsrR (DeoR family)